MAGPERFTPEQQIVLDAGYEVRCGKMGLTAWASRQAGRGRQGQAGRGRVWKVRSWSGRGSKVVLFRELVGTRHGPCLAPGCVC